MNWRRGMNSKWSFRWNFRTRSPAADPSDLPWMGDISWYIMIYHDISTLNGVKPTQNWGAPTSGIWINGQLRAIRVSLEMGYKIEGSQPAGRSWWTVCQMAPSILPKSFMCKFLKEISGPKKVQFGTFSGRSSLAWISVLNYQQGDLLA
jgi:hypothetical protein